MLESLAEAGGLPKETSAGVLGELQGAVSPMIYDARCAILVLGFAIGLPRPQSQPC